MIASEQPPPNAPPPKRKAAVNRASSRLADAAHADTAAALGLMETSPDGLSETAACERLGKYGPNEVSQEQHNAWSQRLLHSVRNPLVILLSVLAIITFATAHDPNDPSATTANLAGGWIMVVMVILGVALRFIQESRADAAAAKLKAMIRVTATVIREGKQREVPLGQLVPGDIVKLSAGDMVPGDVRVLSSKDLFIIQATLTGESLPVEKFDVTETRDNISPLEFSNICFLGTSVESGTAQALVVETGPQTYLGTIAKSMSGQLVETSFDKGIKRFTWLMLRFMAVMVPAVFVINGVLKGDWKEAFLFALAVAVGLTPEMLPMIVSVCLSKGAMAMSRKKVIVKRLNSIQNFGAMDVLCTDKTGTLTMDHVILEIHCDVFKNESDPVLKDAYLISHFQTGLKNVLDRAVLEHPEALRKSSVETYRKVDEIPFDFSRRMMSVIVETPEGDYRMLTKGAPESVFSRCSQFESDGEFFPMEPILMGDLVQEYNDLSADGFRVLAVAEKKLDKRNAYSKADESDLILKGYIAFLDPPKETASKAIAALQQHGVTCKVLTGDNDLVTRKVCNEVGLATGEILLGNAVENMSDQQLSQAVEKTHVFARLSPTHKQRVIEALRRNGHVVGFIGDGINDAPALRAADVGISVDNAVDIAKESADMILLEKNLMVLEEGVLEGRKVFVNILKYIRMGASSNFGNMFSVLGASILFPFVPMLPIQILTNNLLYDFSQVPIPTDNVGPDLISKPLPWDMGEITRFILFIGPVSSIFDYTTYALMWFFFQCRLPGLPAPAALAGQFLHADADHVYRAALFQTGWFVESLMTQTLIIHVIRTRQIPFIQARASLPLTMTTVIIMAVGAWLPYSPLAPMLRFVPLPVMYWPFIFVTLLCYVVLTQLVKMWLIRKRWL
ncbi:MAG TPA: magnesium-translocating P-type ATPase [Verrucomicrobiae bacterium]|jgi:Mg2+-importing ATPase|nr:magnesium-translocating P-type ATPase [Verrucomicrobiae bacterium]